MRNVQTPAACDDLATRYAARIESHFARLAAGHDPMGHLFAIERLARAARAERWAAQRRPEPQRSDP